MINEGPRQRDPLRHSTGEMMWIGIGKCFETDQAHELLNLTAFLLQQPARNQTGLNISPYREPWKQIRILKNKSALSIRTGDLLWADQKFSGIGEIEAGDETQQRGFSAAARADKRNKFAGAERDRDLIQHGPPLKRIAGRRKTLTDFTQPERGCYHLIIPFCQTSTRSRSLKSKVMMVEKNAAMMTSAA